MEQILADYAIFFVLAALYIIIKVLKFFWLWITIWLIKKGVGYKEGNSFVLALGVAFTGLTIDDIKGMK